MTIEAAKAKAEPAEKLEEVSRRFSAGFDVVERMMDDASYAHVDGRNVLASRRRRP